MNPDIAPLLPLAKAIARDFSNIPGLGPDEIEARALEALAAASRGFDPLKGSDFKAYASVAIRNSLRSLFEQQVRHYRHHQYVLDQPVNLESTQADAVQNVKDARQESVGTQVQRKQCISLLNELLHDLPDRSRLVVLGISEGRSYADLGKELGISKQAVHKVAMSALGILRDKLAERGFHGVDTVGMLATSRLESEEEGQPD